MENCTINESIEALPKTTIQLELTEKNDTILLYIQPIIDIVNEENLDKNFFCIMINSFLVKSKSVMTDKIYVTRLKPQNQLYITTNLNQHKGLVMHPSTEDVSKAWRNALKKLVNYFHHESTTLEIKNFIHEYFYDFASQSKFLPREVKSIQFKDEISNQNNLVLLFNMLHKEMLYIIISNLNAKELAVFQLLCRKSYEIVNDIQKKSETYYAIDDINMFNDTYCISQKETVSHKTVEKYDKLHTGIVNSFFKTKKLKLFISLYQALFYMTEAVNRKIKFQTESVKSIKSITIARVKYFDIFKNLKTKEIEIDKYQGVKQNDPDLYANTLKALVSYETVLNSGKIVPEEIIRVDCSRFTTAFRLDITDRKQNTNKFK